MIKLLYKAVKNPIISPIILLSIGAFFLSVYYMPKLSKENQRNEAVEETSKLISLFKHTRAYYTDNIINKVEKNTDLKINFDHMSHADTIPLPATTIHELSEHMTKDDDIQAKFYSAYPFPNRKGRILDAFEKEALKFFEKNPDKVFAKEDTIGNKRVFRVAAADIMTSQTCVNCHNSRADSPKRDWKLGDVRGALEVSIPLSENFMLSGRQIMFVLFFIGFVLVSFMLHYGIIYLRREKELLNEALILEDEINTRTKDLKESNQLLLEYKKAVDASAIVSKSDLNGDIVYVNDAFCEISGYSREDLIGRPHKIVRSPDMPKKFYKNMWDTIKQKDIFKGIIKNISKDGSPYYVAATIVPILNDKNEICEYLSLRYNITELVDAKNRAINAEKAKGVFLANMSHEIRTPLNAIIGFSTILCDSEINNEAKEYADIISRSAKSLLGIINDVLDISKIESGKLKIVDRPFDFEEFCENIVELFWVSAQEKNIRLVYNMNPLLPFNVVSDATRLQQVISNLLSNAIKFTPDNGAVEFNISLAGISKKEADIKFSVKDSGIGMTQEQQKRIFEPFSQADDGISRKYGGTGLGLAICLDIVKLMGSTIKVYSEPDEGSEFSFTLKLKIDNIITDARKENLQMKFALSHCDADKKSIKESIARYLEEMGEVAELGEIYCEDADAVFCFDEESILEVPQMQDGKIIYVGREQELKSLRAKERVKDYIDDPVYGSKISAVIKKRVAIKSSELKSEKRASHKFKAHLLVAEDNPNNQRLMEVLLKELGISATVVSNGYEAIEAYKNSKFDMILMDVNMPELDGVSATKEILRLQDSSGYCNIPIIALTANSISGDKERYLEAGMSDYLSKPIEMEAFIEILEKYTGYKNDADAARYVPKQYAPYNKNDTMKQLRLNEMTVDMLLDSFFLTLDDDIARLDEAIKLGDTDSIKSAAHYIRSSCSNLAMKEAADILEHIEKNPHDADTQMLIEVFEKIKKTVF